MKQKTIQQLNQLNRHFYQNIAADFAASRNYSWQGWEKLIKFLPQKKLEVLDIACGNARWADFLSEKEVTCAYLGLDNSAELLNFAKKDLKLINFDLIANYLENETINWPVKNKFDLVVAFGLSHHLPSQKLRQDFIRSLAALVKPDGLIVLSNWQFAREERFKKNILNIEKIKKNKKINIFQRFKLKKLLKNLEKDDYLLDWRRWQKNKARPAVYRYCHFLSEKEMKELIKNSSLKLLDSFFADGKSRSLNQYFLLKKKG